MAIRGVNRVQLIGFIGKAPEVRYTANQTAATTLSLATSESWRDQATGEPKERTEWHRVVLFGKLAEVAGEYLQVGALVYIEGENRTRQWDDNGVTRYITEVVVGRNGTMQMLDRKPSDSNVPAAPASQEEPPISDFDNIPF